MNDTASCPYCGAPAGPEGTGTVRGRADGRMGALGPLYTEVRRIREIAEANGPEPPRETAVPAGTRTPAGCPDGSRPDGRDEDLARIAELTTEVRELRATVARLRGSMGAVPVRSG